MIKTRYAPKVIDIRTSLILRALCTPAFVRSPGAYENIIAAAQGAHVVSGSSVRSLFAAYLSSLLQRKPARVIFTAITLEDMARVARDLGYQVESVGIDPSTQQPDLEELAALLARHPGSVVVLTPLFGAIVDYAGAITLCRQHGAKVVIDNAQGFRGPQARDYDGYDLLLWSFGPIKTMTALGGGIALLQDRQEAEGLRATIQAYPTGSNLSFRLRLLKYSVLSWLSRPRGFTLLMLALQALSIEPNKVMTGATRGYDARKGLLDQLRRRPSLMQQQLMHLQLRHYDAARIQRRASYGSSLAGHIGEAKLFGGAVPQHSFWLTPVIARDVDALTQELVQNGFYASRQTSSLRILNPERHAALKAVFDTVVYVPIDPSLPEDALAELCRLTWEHA